MARLVEVVQPEAGRPILGVWEVRPELLVNVPALQPKITGQELTKYFPDYSYKPKTVEELQWEKEAEEDNGLPF